MEQPLIVAKGIAKKFSTASAAEVLKGVDLTVKVGEKIAIIGKSGAGKSTLLHVLGTLEKPTAGEILFEGEDVFSYDDTKLAQYRNAKIGFVFQFHYLMLEFTALENVMIPMLLGGVNPSDARREALDLLGLVGLSHRVAHKPSQLSGGEQQRVAIARALSRSPKLLLTDEMTGNLDGETGRAILDLVDSIQRERGMTLISVTHDDQVAARSPFVYRLEAGTLVAKTPFG
ncbi:MAG: ABC transporter ATP-binding protein [Deltaproteobacteria bacterium]|nr:ABC transporter ATP-binding protein [Deltaproteobacteria bacterium]MBI3296404.1 ABC transporter ATP-binding protein [Deltaproteobacteria bacterium]